MFPDVLRRCRRGNVGGEQELAAVEEALARNPEERAHNVHELEARWSLSVENASQVRPTYASLICYEDMAQATFLDENPED